MGVNHVAVYGTLRLNQGNWSWALAHKPHVGTHRLDGFELYSGPGFPYAAKKEGSQITVDLFGEIDAETLQRLDGLEGHWSAGDPRNHYDRGVVKVDGVEAFIYFVDREEVKHSCLITSGDWLNREETFSMRGFSLG